MDIKEIDKNFLSDSGLDLEHTDFYDATDEAFDLYGIEYYNDLGRFCRMPSDVAQSVSEGVAWLSRHTAGGRLRFSTNSTHLSIIVKYDGLENFTHMTTVGTSGFSLCKNCDGQEIFVDSPRPEFHEKNGFARRIFLANDNKTENYTLYFPLYNNVTSVTLGFDQGAIIGKGLAHKKINPILYYGSSITQGGCASRPDTCYQAQIYKENNIDFVNLGFSGNGRAEIPMMEYLSRIKCSIFVYDYDHNADTVEYLKQTHLRGYEIFRKANPKTPIIFVSKPDYLRHDGEARFQVIKETYDTVKSRGDENVYLIDGRKFFQENYDIATVDGTHPTDLGFYLMAKKIGKQIKEILSNGCVC